MEQLHPVVESKFSDLSANMANKKSDPRVVKKTGPVSTIFGSKRRSDGNLVGKQASFKPGSRFPGIGIPGDGQIASSFTKSLQLLVQDDSDDCEDSSGLYSACMKPPDMSELGSEARKKLEQEVAATDRIIAGLPSVFAKRVELENKLFSVFGIHSVYGPKRLEQVGNEDEGKGIEAGKIDFSRFCLSLMNFNWGRYALQREWKRFQNWDWTSGYHRTNWFEKVLANSRNPTIKQASSRFYASITNGNFWNPSKRETMVNEVGRAIFHGKGIYGDTYQEFGPKCGKALSAIAAYIFVCRKMDEIRSTNFEVGDLEDTEKLNRIWIGLTENNWPIDIDTLTSVRDWRELGFEGEHILNDLSGNGNGIGRLAINCLLYLVENDEGKAKRMLDRTKCDVYGYPFGCVCVYIAHLAHSLLASGKAKTQFYNVYEILIRLKRCLPSDRDTSPDQMPGPEYSTNNANAAVRTFYDFFTALLTHFNDEWIAARPGSAQEPHRFKATFERNLNLALENEGCQIQLSRSFSALCNSKML